MKNTTPLGLIYDKVTNSYILDEVSLALQNIKVRVESNHHKSLQIDLSTCEPVIGSLNEIIEYVPVRFTDFHSY